MSATPVGNLVQMLEKQNPLLKGRHKLSKTSFVVHYYCHLCKKTKVIITVDTTQEREALVTLGLAEDRIKQSKHGRIPRGGAS